MKIEPYKPRVVRGCADERLSAPVRWRVRDAGGVVLADYDERSKAERLVARLSR